LTLPDGSQATSNADSVRAVADLIRALGMVYCDATEIRTIFGAS